MTLEHLENLEKIGRLKFETPDQAEFNGLLESAKRRLNDATVEEVSEEGRFLSAYGAAHALSVAALRWHGYLASERYLVFQ
jgi:myosin-crossreactive antigen